MTSFWTGLDQGRRIGLACGAVMVLALVVALGWWALRTDYDVLFAKLSPQDAAAMTRELDRMKVPYKLTDDGTSILVDKRAVPHTRLSLMGKDLPLNGAVGFEVFNNVDFGMTEFAQKVNYQRALQGELTRTILSIAEVESARVHLALPDDGLFKRDSSRGKASITLSLHNGQSLRRDQVKGIQRLVAAAIPGIQVDDVTIVNAQGVALTQDGAEGGAGTASLRMEFKREVEQLLAQKANAMLDKAVGQGVAFASVDVTLDMNQMRVTTEDVTTPKAADGEGAAGVVVRERETVRDAARPGASTDDAQAAGQVHRELDYQVGRRVEQVVSSPGAVTRLHALAVLRGTLNANQVEQVRQLLATAVGANLERGDTVVVQAMDGLAAAVRGAPPAVLAPPPGAGNAPALRTAAPVELSSVSRTQWATALALMLVGIGLVVWRLRSRMQQPRVMRLTHAQRDASLLQITAWLNDTPAATRQGERR